MYHYQTNRHFCLQIMAKVISDGQDFVSREEARLNKLLTTKLKDAKKAQGTNTN